MYKVGRRRTPQGVRGLKLLGLFITLRILVSHSARSAWIETSPLAGGAPRAKVALRKECVD